MLQDRTTKQVYVDIDQDLDFTDETPMIDFKVNRDVGHFGVDNPATPVREQVPFVVVTDRSNPRPGVHRRVPRQHRHRRCRSTARTSPASPPPTACSAVR